MPLKVLLLLALLTLLIPTSHQNQHLQEMPKYEPKKVENRPWTNVFETPIKLEKRVPPHFMHPLTRLQFQTNCDGQCFFHLGDPTQQTTKDCTPKDKDCRLMASIAWHGPEQCSFFGKASGTLTETICEQSKDKKLYTISLLRHINEPSCKLQHYFSKLQMICVPREFVAVAFYVGEKDLVDEDKWYVCTAGEQTVTFWENVKSNPTQVLDTIPHRKSAPGVIAASIKYDEFNRMLACKFIISTELMANDPSSLVKFPNGPYSGPPIKVKLSQGRVSRNLLSEDKVPPSLFPKPGLGLVEEVKTKEEIDAEKKYYHAQQAIKQPEFVEQNPPAGDEFMFANDFVGPSTDTIDFSGLEVDLVQVHTIPTDDEDKAIADEITKLTRRCNRPQEDGRLRCFYPNNQKSCIFRQRCQILFMIEEVVYQGRKVLQVHLLTFTVKDPTTKHVLRPSGWAAIGFSKDNKMGDDIVMACVLRGPGATDILVSWNGKHANEYRDDSNQDLIFDKQPIKFLRTNSTDKFLCQWKMNWKLTVELNKYALRKRKTTIQNAPVIFDFENHKNGMFLLIAKGGWVYESGRIGYHSFRETMQTTLKVKHVRGVRKFGAFTTRIHSEMFLCLACIFFVFLAK